MNNICHWELQTRDPSKAKAFYEALFGWTVKHEREMNYVLIETGTEPPNGGMNIVTEMEQSGATLYVLVDDVDAKLEKARELGGSILTPKTAIPNMGFFGILRDGEGNRVGLFSPSKE